MKKIFLLIYILVLLIGCTPKYTSKLNTEGKSFAVASYKNIPSFLCHEHTGYTIWGNFESKYQLNTNLNELLPNGYISGLESAGKSAMIVKIDLDFINGIESSSWSGKRSLNENAKNFLKELNSKDIGYFVLPHLLTSDYSNDKGCIGPLLDTGKNNYNMPLKHGSGASVFDTGNGQFVGFAFARNNYHVVDSPKDPKHVTKAEIKYYEKMIVLFAESSIHEFLKGK